jgi:predicted nucleic acid-binding protein
VGLRRLAATPRGRKTRCRVIQYLIDSSAAWRLSRDEALEAAWGEEIDILLIGSCSPQRTEFRRSATNAAHYQQMVDMFDDLYPNVTVPKGAWAWIESAQHSLSKAGGAVRALSTVDLLICGTAAHHGLIVLHDDNDFVTAARTLPDVTERNIHDIPR